MSLIFYRVGNLLHRKNVPVFPKLCTILGQIILGAYVPSTCHIGHGSKLAYGGSGVVIHAAASIGKNCVISPGVVVGGRAKSGSIPIIGDNVQLFPGAKVLGNVRVGDGAQIGANAVVIHDIAPGATVVAPLGRVLGKTYES